MIIEIKIQKWKTERWDEEVHTHFDVIITIIFTRVIRRYKSNMLLCCWLRDASDPSTRVSIIIMTSLWNLNKVFLSHFLYHEIICGLHKCIARTRSDGHRTRMRVLTNEQRWTYVIDIGLCVRKNLQQIKCMICAHLWHHKHII